MRTSTGLPRRMAVRSWRMIRFAVYFTGEFLAANGQVLWEILTPRSRSAPAIVALPLESRSNREIVTLTSLVTLTPGTLALEVALDPPTLYVHGMFVHDPDGFTDQLRRLERRMLTALRPVDG